MELDLNAALPTCEDGRKICACGNQRQESVKSWQGVRAADVQSFHLLAFRACWFSLSLNPIDGSIRF